MNIADTTLPIWLNHLLNLVFLGILFLSLKTYRWRDLASDNGLQHRLGFSAILLIVIWSLRAGLTEGLGIHFYLITCFHLMFGWQLSILLVFLVQIGMIVVGNETWHAFGINSITSGFIPICTTYLFWRFVEYKRYYNPFAFIFFIAFGGGAVAVIASGIFMTAIFLALDIYTFNLIVYEFWAFVPLISLPEGILNGMAIAALIVFKPSWVVMYDEEKYLKNF